MNLRNKTTLEFRTVLGSPLGVPNSQVSLYSTYSTWSMLRQRQNYMCFHLWSHKPMECIFFWKSNSRYMYVTYIMYISIVKLYQVTIQQCARLLLTYYHDYHSAHSVDTSQWCFSLDNLSWLFAIEANLNTTGHLWLIINNISNIQYKK